MTEELCDICGFRPVSARITLVKNGRQTTLDVCAVDLKRLQQQGSYISSLDALFAGEGYLGEYANDRDMLEDMPQDRHQETVDISKLLSEHCKQLVQRAAEIAVSFGRSEMDTEHLLYALSESPIVEDVLRQFKIDTKEVREFLDGHAPKQKNESPEQMGISPRVKRVLEQSLPISQELGHGYIGPEHLLISLAEEDEGMAGDLLRGYGLSSESLRQKTLKVVGKGAKEGRIQEKSATPNLDKYSRDLSKLAAQGKLDPVVGRSEEIETTIEILSRRTKNNPALIGEPGVGKTAIVEGLAQRIYARDVPETLRGKRMVELNINSMVAGSRFRGDFEERVKNVLDEVIAHQDELVLFVDELHTIVGTGSGGNEGGLDISNVIKPALARGELHLIGATTLNEYQKYIEKDSALERRFQPVIIPEPSVEQTIEILRGLRDRYEAHHRVKILDEALVAAAELSDRYITNRFLPDKAIDLIDQAASRVRIALSFHSPEIRSLEDEMNVLQREQEYASTHRQFDRAKELEAAVADKNKIRDELTDEWRRQKGVTSAEVDIRQIAAVVSKLTGIPVTELTQEERQKLLHLEERLHERVIGQEEAISAVSDAVRRARSGLADRNRPLASFLFLGPTGVGKTELAKSLAQHVYGDENAITRIDMSEYREPHTVARLIGAPPGYVGYEEGGQLTEVVRRHPYTILLLDEIEKAHPEVYNLLLQLLDEGRLTDGKGRVVSFTNTIIIATSNLGSSFDMGNPIGFSLSDSARGADLDQEKMRERVLEEVRSHFRPEFINRLDDLIVFHSLSKSQIEQIVGLQLERVKKTAKAQNISLHFDQSVITHLADAGYNTEYGARELKRKIQVEVENNLARELLLGSLSESSQVVMTFDPKKGVQIVPSKLSKKEVLPI
jgi:ATP-dependent Clp protease ATP-binding subunit ClpC